MNDAHRPNPLSPHDVSVVIPVHAPGDAALRTCLAHLAAADPRPREVIVVADGPGDGSWRVAAEFGARVIELPRRGGAGAARNAGARAAEGIVLFFVDADVAIAPDAVGRVVAAMNEHPEWSGVFGSYDDAPGADNFVAQYKGLLNHYVHQHARPEAFTFWTALGAIRRDVFFAVGGLNSHYTIEDVELGYRLRAAGYRIGTVHTLLAKHLKRWTASSLVRSDFFERALPWTGLILRYHSAERDLNLDTANRLGVVGVFTLLACLLAAAFAPAVGLPLAAGVAGALLLLNRRLYAFFLRHRGPRFLAGAIAWHWFYFGYGGAAFVLGAAHHFVRGRRVGPRVAPVLGIGPIPVATDTERA